MRFILLLSIFLLGSCDDGFEELNVNPLFPTEAQDGPVFNNIIQSLRLGWNRQLFLHNEKLYDVTELAVVTAETFGNIEGGAEDVWSNYYQALKDARDLETRFDAYADQETTDLVRAQLKVLMAYKTFQVTDFFGSIPYFEAGRAYDNNAVLRPVYDDHETIYKSLIDDLLWAIDRMNNATGTTSGEAYLSFGGFDTLFDNDLNQWKSFANSMLLKYLVRIYDKDPGFVAPLVASLIESGASFVSKGNDVVMMPSQQGWQNQGVNWSFREHNKVRLGSNLWTYTTEGGEIIDPRMSIFFEPNNEGEWRAFPQIADAAIPQSGGNPYSDARDNSYENKGEGNIYASVNYYLIRDENDIPEILMTSAEMKFILAEVFLKGIGTPSDASLAQQNYQNGMLESLEFWQNIMLNSEIWINQSEILNIAGFFAVTEHPRYNFHMAETEEEKLTLIYTQRWIDAFRQPWEAWSLVRQTNLIPREKTENDFHRFKYPPSELNFNADNYNQQVNKMGGDRTDVRLWWQ